MPKSKKSKSSRKRIDVYSKADVPAFEALLGRGPMTIVLVHAKWCPHCTTFIDKIWNKTPNLPTNTIHTASVHHDMLENTSLANAKLEGYPSLLLVGKDKKPAVYKNNEGKETNAMPQPESAEELNKMVNTPVNENLGNSNSVNNSNNENSTPSSLKTSSNILSMNNSNSNNSNSSNSNSSNSNSSNSNSSVKSYKPANMSTNAEPPNAAEDLVTSQQTNKKQMGGGLYQSLLKIMAQMKTRRVRSHKRKQTRRH
jgi:hypothetical protein